MKRCYVPRRFNAASMVLIEQMNGIVDEYLEQGFKLTVRQLYYQLVAAAVIANTVQDYKRIASIVNDAKLAGLMDWDAMEDRTREFIRLSRWASGADILKAVATQYHEDMWSDQERRVFVVVEKEALSGVLAPVCNSLDVPLLAARGYPSGSVVWEFVEQDIIPAIDKGQHVVILHLGDHDPSGVDMTRDLNERVRIFCDGESHAIELQRIALNMPQVEELSPPENPAKQTDTRFTEYARRFGGKSWELDALKPDYLADLIRTKVAQYVDAGKWKAKADEVATTRDRLLSIATEFEK
jgi:hypothetical protein